MNSLYLINIYVKLGNGSLPLFILTFYCFYFRLEKLFLFNICPFSSSNGST